MRSVALTMMLMLAALAGCESGGRRFVFGPSPTPPPPPGGAPSVESLVEYMNDNARRVQSLRCTDVDITAKQNFQSFGLRGKMMTMKSRNFLMTATALGSPVVDLGSNEDEFWFWFSKAPDPYQYFCTYKDFEEGRVANFPFPFQPEWIMEALGMGPYGPANKYTLEAEANVLKLTEKTRTPQGQSVRKVIVINRRAVQAPNPQVQAYLLINETSGKEICSAHVLEVMLDPATGALVPRKLELRVPDQNARLNLIFNGMTVNPQLDAASFQRRPLQGVQSIDLARGPGGGGRPPGSAP